MSSKAEFLCVGSRFDEGAYFELTNKSQDSEVTRNCRKTVFSDASYDFINGCLPSTRGKTSALPQKSFGHVEFGFAAGVGFAAVALARHTRAF